VSWPVNLADYSSEKDQVLLQYIGHEAFSGLSAFERDVLYDCEPGPFPPTSPSVNGNQMQIGAC
jgi:hypothetical protein